MRLLRKKWEISRKRVVILLGSCFLMAGLLMGCSSNPCENCGNTPTKGFKNEKTREKEYYCKHCYSSCDLCGDDADRHYTGGGGIIFICDDCYDELKSYGWIN